MAANVETMFSNRETPWHGLGTIVYEAPTSADALRLAGLDWRVNQQPVYTYVNTPFGNSRIEIPGFKANVRSTDNQVLGMVTDRYRVVQNVDAFDFTDALLGEGVRYETAGSLANGKRMWLLAKLEGTKLQDEQVDPYLVFTNSHDGKSGIQVAICAVRVVCQNTLNLALNTASRQWSAKHTGDIELKLDEARATLMNAKAYMKGLEEEFGELKTQPLSDVQVMNYIKMLLPTSELETERKRNATIDLQKRLWNIYDKAPDLEYEERSAFRFVNAVSDLATHTEPGRKTKDWKANRFMKTIDGNPLIDAAYIMMKEAV